MIGWAQLTIAVWLFTAIVGGAVKAIRVGDDWLVLEPRHQRIAAAGLTAAAIGEALTLWLGGFFG